MGQPRLNLKNAVALLADRDVFTRGLIAQMLRGFGIDSILIANDGKETKEIFLNTRPDICFIEGALPDIESPELLNWIRRQADDALRFVPTVILSGYTQLRLVSAARDSGAHIVVRKPISPQVLFDRILWVASSTRPFLDAGHYVGPDRRFHVIPPPQGVMRRVTDTPIAQEA